jgi:hypothetical protein
MQVETLTAGEAMAKSVLVTQLGVMPGSTLTLQDPYHGHS